MSTGDAEVAVIGGGSAGLSAALTLGRARRPVIVIDTAEPRNTPADAVHGLLGNEGINPLELLRRGRQEVTAYGGRLIRSRITRARALGDRFHLRTDNGVDFTAANLVIATGTADQLPDIPGLAQRWGRDVIHCPYCHGWEFRDRRIGVLATGPMSALQALMFSQWSSDVRFFSQGLDYGDDIAGLVAAGVDVDSRRIIAINAEEDRLSSVRLDDGSLLALDALVAPSPTRARLEGLDGLGLEVRETTAGTAVVADPSGRTNVPGVWAAGNITNPALQVSESIAHGARVAMTLNTELILRRIGRPVKGEDAVR